MTQPLDIPPQATSLSSRAWKGIQNRILAGLFLVLPVLVTFWILYWLYTLLATYVVRPAARVIIFLVENRTLDAELPFWFEYVAAPVLGIVGVGGLLYVLGLLARSRIVHWMELLLLRLPVVTVVYHAVKKAFQTFQNTGDLQQSKRVVLVAFPHPGMRVPAFVTATCRDVQTQRTILCVYVPTTPIPTSGYMILLPEEEVTELDWSLDETIQAVVSFGVTAPDHVRYYRETPA